MAHQVSKSKRRLPFPIDELHGFAQGSRNKNLEARGKFNNNTPRFVLAEPPEHMSALGRVLWYELMPTLVEAKLLTIVDVVAFELLCEAYSDWCGAREDIANNVVERKEPKTGRKYFVSSRYYSVVTETGSVVPRLHPAVGVMQDADRRIRSWMCEFGMTPSSRSALDGRAPLDGRTPLASMEGEVLDIDQLDDVERVALREMLERRVEAMKAVA